MNNEQELDQQKIDELLNTANKELSEPTTSSLEDSEIQQNSVLEPADSSENIITPLKEAVSIKKYLTKKSLLLIILLFSVIIAMGGFLGYKIATNTIATRPPLEKLIQQGITFEEKNLVFYAGHGDKDTVNAFLEAGMAVDAIRPTDGWTPLMAASFYKQFDIVTLLLEQQASVNQQDKYGRTALMYAAAMGAEDIVILLLDHGANTNLQDKNGRTALMEAYFKKHAKIAEILKNAGAIPPIETNEATKVSPLSKSTHPPLSAALPSDETRLSTNRAGFIQIGMSLEDIQKKYPNLTVTEKYMDGSKKTIASIYLNGSSIPSLLIELSSGKLKLVSTISIYDAQFSTDKHITINSTVDDIRTQYTINDFKVIDNSLFIVVRSTKMLFELDLTQGVIPSEWLNTGNPNSIPGDTKVKRIVLY